jgi:hypothetical protein
MPWLHLEGDGWIEVDDPPRTAVTAGTQPHDDPWQFAGEEADPPEDPAEWDRYEPTHVSIGAVPRTARPWRNCLASVTLINEINQAYPNRDKTSDGTIGDAAHAARTSDHNPWVIILEAGREMGIVRARDIDRDGLPLADIMENLRKRAEAGDPRLAGGGYLIYNRRISSRDFKAWRVYTGTNPHTSHGHVSFSQNRAGYDSTAPWGIATAGKAPIGGDDFLAALNENEQRELLALVRNLNFQLFEGEGQRIGAGRPGWATWKGGTGEVLTAIDLLRRANVQLEDLKRQVVTVADTEFDPQEFINALTPLIRGAVLDVLGEWEQAKADEIIELMGQRLIGDKEG